MASKRDQLEGDFLTLIRRGLTAREAASLLGIHRSTAQRWLKRIGEAEPPAPRKRTPVRAWFESDDPAEAAILGAIRKRMIELDPRCNRDDPRDFLAMQASDDVEIVALRKQLLMCVG